MEIQFTKGNGKYSYLKCIREDQTSTETKMPEQGIAPHDMIHFIVEKTLKIHGAFYGQLKAGANISFTMEHNEASREVSSKQDVWQTESMVESLQSLLWSDALDYENFCYLVTEACDTRKIVKPIVSHQDFLQIMQLLLELNAQWANLQKGSSIKVQF
ncbi:cytoplasmic protein [Shewanella sp. OPT22]|nr:cytoplasmic protein [Shewanella sp. OPT22]